MGAYRNMLVMYVMSTMTLYPGRRGRELATRGTPAAGATQPHGTAWSVDNAPAPVGQPNGLVRYNCAFVRNVRGSGRGPSNPTRVWSYS